MSSSAQCVRSDGWAGLSLALLLRRRQIKERRHMAMKVTSELRERHSGLGGKRKAFLCRGARNYAALRPGVQRVSLSPALLSHLVKETGGLKDLHLRF